MADDLNKQYFEAKETHKRNYIRKGYVIWILIGIGIVVFYFGRQYFEGRKYETLKKEKTNEFLSRIENGHSDIQLSTLFKLIELGLGRKISLTIE
jgi:HTH-type transcriptional regulator / antitoxin HipB